MALEADKSRSMKLASGYVIYLMQFNAFLLQNPMAEGGRASEGESEGIREGPTCCCSQSILITILHLQ